MERKGENSQRHQGPGAHGGGTAVREEKNISRALADPSQTSTQSWCRPWKTARSLCPDICPMRTGADASRRRIRPGSVV